MRWTICAARLDNYKRFKEWTAEWVIWALSTVA